MYSIICTRFLPFLLFASLLPLAAAQKSVLIPLLPASNWQLVASNTLTLHQLQKYGDQTAVDRELGVQSGTQRLYQQGSAQVFAIFEEAADPSSAYGLFTFYQKQGMRPEPGMQMVMTDPRGALMTRGRYFIRVLRPARLISERDFRSLLTMIGGARLSVENAESLPMLLPSAGLVPGSEKYLLGVQTAQRVLPSFPVNLIGFKDGVEAEVGTYVSAGAPLKLLEISYPTPQIARIQFTAMQKSTLHINQDHSLGSIYGRQDGSYVLLVLNAKSGAAANRLLDQFQVAQTLSWSPSYRGKGSFVYQMLELVVANLELVGIITFFAIIGGVAIFSTKLLILKLFPKSSWIRSDEDELIRLRLS